MRIVYCLDNLGIGGTELNALRTAEHLDRRRFEVMVVCFRDDGVLSSRFKAAGIPVHAYPIGRFLSPRMLVQTTRFARFLRRERIALVHCHDRYSNPFGVAAARRARVPVIASKRWGEATFRHRVVNALAFRSADAVIGNSPSVVDSLLREDRVDPARIVMVPNFVDDTAFQPIATAARVAWLSELGLRPDQPVIGIIASLRPVKNHEQLLRAMTLLVERLPQSQLVIVGDGESRASLTALTGELGLGPQVRFAGTRPNAPNLHSCFDVSVLCSRTEGFPNSIIEAMAAGRPVVGTDVVGIRDAVRHGETGFLVRFGDAADLASALERLLRDRALARHFGEAGLAWARRSFHVEPVIAQLEALYERLVPRGPE